MEQQNVTRIFSGNKEIVLVGTAHISKESVDQVKSVIEAENPNQVCVELDAGRLNSLKDPNRWKSLDLRAVIRQGQLSTLIANLVLASYQKRMGDQTGVKPGTELMAAVETSERLNIDVILADRDVKITLRRAWGFTPFFGKLKLLSGLFASIFDKTEVSEEQLREIRSKDTLSSMMDDLGTAFPQIKETVINERDHFLAGKVLAAKGPKVVAVVGAGHVPGMQRIIESGLAPRSESELNEQPPKNSFWKTLLWALPILFIGSMIWIAYTQGFSAMGNNLLYWFLVTGTFGAVGAAIALPHPLVVLVAFIMTPLKPFRPFVGLGIFTSLSQAYLAPPRVEEMEKVTDEINKIGLWWKNRMLKIALVGITPAPLTMLGYFIAGRQIWQNINL